MKLFTKSLILAFTVCLIVSDTTSVSISSIGGINIIRENGILKCDTLICPANTVQCHVYRRNNSSNPSKIITTRQCIGDTILAENTTEEDNLYGSHVDLNIVSGGGVSNVRQLTPEEERDLEEHLKRTQERIHTQVTQNLNNLNHSLRPLLDGSFAANLQNRIRAEVSESLRSSIGF